MKGYLLFATLLVLACNAQVKPINKDMSQQATTAKEQLPIEGKFPSLNGATGWLNSSPLTTNDLRGKIVVINFCTYTCINWLRSLPYVRAWAEKYKDKAVVVIGVHTPEFIFEKETPNIKPEIAKRKLDYPIAIDNDYSIWNAFNNHYWPALYFIDAKGNIRHHQFGEGGYEQSEKVIQQLLMENGAESIDTDLVTVNPPGDEAAPDWDNLQSLENYLGYDRTQNFAPGAMKLNKQYTYTVPLRLSLNQWALSGEWLVKNNSIVLKKSGGRIVYQFHARDLHLVMGPASPGTSIRFRLLIDGKAPGASHGTDVDEDGNGIITEQRMYQLLRQPAPIIDRKFEIEFIDAGAEAFSFTFG
jgi:thiol-disulfide isomerase/thioredoxin